MSGANWSLSLLAGGMVDVYGVLFWWIARCSVVFYYCPFWLCWGKGVVGDVSEVMLLLSEIVILVWVGVVMICLFLWLFWVC